MFFSLDVRRARKGDCLILHYGSKTNPGLGLIDGGPSQVYGPHLKPRLQQIRKMRKLGPDDPLPVDFLMVSHIDDDHINGVLELTKELLEAKAAKKPLPLKIKSVWHNTFDDIIGNNPKELTAAVTAQFGAASLTGDPDVDGLDPEVAKVLASVSQGFRLRDDIRGLKLRNNPDFKGGLVIAKKKAKAIDMGKGLKFTVVGPMHDEVVELQKDHDAFLKKKEEKGTAGLLAAFTDSSVANLSSVVVLAEVGKKRMLLTGDARGDKVLEGLELLGLLKKDGKSTMHVDVFKAPHHGSDRNADPILFRRVTADHYVFSGNGEHGNPERETLQMVFDERGDEDDFTIHITYPIDEIDAGRKADWEKEQKKEKAKKKKNPKVKVRANWSAKKNSLAAFFAAHKKFAEKVLIVPEDEPHLINLIDEV
jgi:hypothetical protein